MLDIKLYLVLLCGLAYCVQLEGTEGNATTILTALGRAAMCKQSKKCIKKGGTCGNSDTFPSGAKHLGFCNKKKNCLCYYKAAEEKKNFQYECFTKDPNTKGVAGAVFTKWPNNQVPYQFDSSFKNIDRLTFKTATQQIAAATCVSFVESSASQYLLVSRECACGGNCFNGAYVAGMGAGSPRRLVLGSPCMNPNNQNNIGLLVHEILHALGIGHTQTRPDRNSYITVYLQNLKPDPPQSNICAACQYERCQNCNTYGTPYDCSSIMHYRDWAFAQDGKVSMTAKSSSCDLKKNNEVLTSSDKQLINKIYGCPSPPPPPPPGSSSSCSGNCGGKANTCWCDDLCSGNNDCCQDYISQCKTSPPSPPPPPPPSCSLTCSNSCGSKVSCNGKTCWCDNGCSGYGDCCKDKSTFC